MSECVCVCVCVCVVCLSPLHAHIHEAAVLSSPPQICHKGVYVFECAPFQSCALLVVAWSSKAPGASLLHASKQRLRGLTS